METLALWWLLLLAMHAVAAAFFGGSALFYHWLEDTNLGRNLQFVRIGMKSPAYKTIELALPHALLILKMLGASLARQSFAFSTESDEVTDAARCLTLEWLRRSVTFRWFPNVAYEFQLLVNELRRTRPSTRRISPLAASGGPNAGVIVPADPSGTAKSRHESRPRSFDVFKRNEANNWVDGRSRSRARSITRRTSLQHLGAGLSNASASKCILYLAIAVHVALLLWGVLVLGYHLAAELAPALPQCLFQVRPWGMVGAACALVDLDCHALRLSGAQHEMDAALRVLNPGLMKHVVLRHCHALEMPPVLTTFSALSTLKLYNATVAAWDAAAALTNANHPRLETLFFARVRLPGGRLPPGLGDPPATELSLGLGNPIRELPGDLFAVTGTMVLHIGSMLITSLPANVSTFSRSLSRVSFFPDWFDALVLRWSEAGKWQLSAGRTPYCDQLESILNGSSSQFDAAGDAVASTPPSVLMNASVGNRPLVAKTVSCEPTAFSLYWLEGDDDTHRLR